MADTDLRADRTTGKFYPNARHPHELDPEAVPAVYASTCVGDCLEPVYHDGVCLVFSRDEKPEAGDFVGIWLHPDAVADGELPRRVKRLYMSGPPGMTLPWKVRPGDEAEPLIILEQLNPPKLLQVRASRIVAMHKVIATADLNADGTATPRQSEQQR